MENREIATILLNMQLDMDYADTKQYGKMETDKLEEEIENTLRKMCAGKNYREWSEDMINKLYVQIYHIMEVDLHGQDEEVGRLEVTEEMVITAMMMHLNEN